MSLDLGKLSPAPWQPCCGSWGNGGVYPYLPVVHRTAGDASADVQFIELARAAFDVMMRRGWYVVPYDAENSRWIVMNPFGVQMERGGNTGVYFVADDPLTALAEADRYYRENVEGEKPT